MIKECTRGSKNKTYYYIGQREFVVPKNGMKNIIKTYIMPQLFKLCITNLDTS